MQRPIEKYGWEYSGTNNEFETEVFKRSVYIMININNSNLKFSMFNLKNCKPFMNSKTNKGRIWKN